MLEWHQELVQQFTVLLELEHDIVFQQGMDSMTMNTLWTGF